MIRAALSIWILSAVVCLGRGDHHGDHSHDDGHAHHHHDESDHSTSNLKLVSSANTDFATQLYKKLAAQKDLQGKNIFFSPISVTLALAALSSGARGDTYQQLFTGLGFNSSLLTQADVDKAFKSLLTGFNRTSQEDLSAGTALFVQETFSPRAQFMEVVKQEYLADVFALDFHNTTESVSNINKYVAEKTNGKIEKLVEDLDPATLMYLVSYMYFKGKHVLIEWLGLCVCLIVVVNWLCLFLTHVRDVDKWELPFDPTDTKEDVFHVDEQTQVPAHMF